MTNLEKKTEKSNINSKEQSSSDILRMETEFISRVPSMLALGKTSISEFPDEFSQDLWKYAMESIFLYCKEIEQGNQPNKNLKEIDVSDSRIYINGVQQRISTLSQADFEKYFLDLYKLGTIGISIDNGKKGAGFNLFGILAWDFEKKKIFIAPENVAQAIVSFCSRNHIDQKKLEQEFSKYTAILNEWEDYEIPEIGYKPNLKNKIRGFYTVKILFYIFRYASEGRFILSSELFKQALGLKEKTFKDFSKNILKPAIVSINKVYPWMNLSVEGIKKIDKRSISHLDFLFKPFKVFKKDKKVIIDNSIVKIQLGEFQNPKFPTKTFVFCVNHEEVLIEQKKFSDLAFSMLSAAFDKIRINIPIFEKEKKEKFENFFLKIDDFVFLTEKNTDYFSLCRNIKFFCDAVKRNEYEKYIHKNILNPKKYILQAIAEGFFDQKKMDQKLSKKLNETQGMLIWKEILNIFLKYLVATEKLNLSEFSNYFLSVDHAWIEENQKLVIKTNQIGYEKIEKWNKYINYIFLKKFPQIKSMEYEIEISSIEEKFIERKK